MTDTIDDTDVVLGYDKDSRYLIIDINTLENVGREGLELFQEYETDMFIALLIKLSNMSREAGLLVGEFELTLTDTREFPEEGTI